MDGEAPAGVVYREDGQVVVRAPYNMLLNRELRLINGGKPTADADAGVHRLPPHVCDFEAVELAARYRLDLAPEFTDAQAAYTRNLAESSARDGDPVEIPGLAPGVALMPHQFPAVRYGLRNRRIINGDVMGLGKSLEALATVAAGDAFPVVIVCRPKLTLNWAAEIRKFFPQWDVHVVSGTAAAPMLPGAHAVIIGSAALGTVDRRATARARRRSASAPKVFGWVPCLADLEPAALIIDEGHDAKEDTANRTQAIIQLAAPVRARGGLIMDLTGTAIVNRVGELASQLEILGYLCLFGGRKTFLARYSDDDPASLLELHIRLRAWGIMLRRPKSVLSLPPLRRHILNLDPASLDPAVMTRYWLAERDTARYLAGLAAMIAAELGVNRDDARVRAEMKARSILYLVKLNMLRQIIAEAKTPVLIRWVQEQVSRGEKVVVAAHHRTVVAAFAAEFGGLTIWGGQSPQSVEEHKARFQDEPVTTAPAIIVSITAGEVGHTLTGGAKGLLAEYPWSPAQEAQMVDRQHRIGQTRPVDHWRAQVAGTIDDRMERLVFGDKRRRLAAVLDGEIMQEDAEGDERDAAGDVAWELAQDGLDDDYLAMTDAGLDPAGVP